MKFDYLSKLDKEIARLTKMRDDYKDRNRMNWEDVVVAARAAGIRVDQETE